MKQFNKNLISYSYYFIVYINASINGVINILSSG